MAEISLSEAKFSMEKTLIAGMGLSASKFIDTINGASDKPSLAAVVAHTISELERGPHVEAAKALSTQWMKMRNKV